MPYYVTDSGTGWNASNSTDSVQATDVWRTYSTRINVAWERDFLAAVWDYEKQKNNKYKNPDWEV